MNSPLSIIISREYLERVKRKSFIITTILAPVIMLAMMIAPAAFMLLSDSEEKTIAVIDHSGQLAQKLENTDEIAFVEPPTDDIEILRIDESYDAILNIEADAISNPSNIILYTRGTLALTTDAVISSQLNRAIEDIRLEAYNIDNIRKILEEVEADVTLKTIRIDTSEDTETSTGLSYFLGITMDMILYMFILLYGQMVMNSIIEEKNNRVLELVVSSVKPMTLMMGKITGIGLVALTQILIWAVLIGSASARLLPLFMSTPDTSMVDPEIASALAQMSDTGYVMGLFCYMILFFVGGYFFYSSIYAAIGSAVDNIQDGGQLSSIATMPVIIGIVASMAILSNPNSSLAFWISVIPFTSPMAMMSRLPYGVPTWEILLSLVLLYASSLFLIWICAKIYRIGIFMYGKKPNLAEIIRWSRYK